MKLETVQEGLHRDLSSGDNIMTIKTSTFDHLVEMVEQLHLNVCELTTAITGGLNGNPGINDRLRTVEDGVSDLKVWRDEHRKRVNSFLWKVAGSAVVGGGLFGIVVKLIIPTLVKL